MRAIWIAIAATLSVAACAAEVDAPLQSSTPPVQTAQAGTPPIPQLKPTDDSPASKENIRQDAIMRDKDALAKIQAENPRLPDDDPLNPGYMWQDSYDEVNPHDMDQVSSRYGLPPLGQFGENKQTLVRPNWVRITNLKEVSNPNLEMSVTQPPYCWGIPKQGGLIACMIASTSALTINKKTYAPYFKDGIVLIGLDRDAPKKLRATLKDGHFRDTVVKLEFDIEPREYDTSRIDGLPKNMVSEYTPEELRRIRAATARKKKGFASNISTMGFQNGFIYPVTDHIKTTNFGAQRILNGEPKRPHYGVDLAAPKGTPILAPADGIVSLADEDMYFEGSLIMIDHGQGLISYYLHNEDLFVKDGDIVRQGDQIATVGSKGRSTGPHLCWRLKWHGRNLDPELLTEWSARAQPPQ